ncbi:MAG: hypothetical protein IJR00_05850 [Lachnospiraceae bacterium]|nr:hypothetical protein [Lachnospiraceae bacterium]
MKQKRKRAWFPVMVMMLFAFCACGSSDAAPETAATATVTAGASESSAGNTGETDLNEGENLMTDEPGEDVMLQLMIGQEEVTVAWEDNETVDALKELVRSEPLTIEMSMYGGFEQVGSLGRSLPRNDVQTTTQAGDIVLYSGNQIVMFYGSNSWAYTRLGHITDQSASELTELLGSGDVTITIGTE